MEYFAVSGGGGGGGGWGGNPVPPPPIGDWWGNTDRYLAIRFPVGGDWYYGWVRVSVQSLSPGISFTIRDHAYNSVPGAGIFAGETQCDIPTALAVSTVDSNSVNLTWQTFSADTFNLRYRPTGSAIWSEIDTITTTNFTVAGLTGCTEYEYQVAAVCDGPLSGYSASSSHSTDGCCSLPGSVTVGLVGFTSGNVAWGGVTAANSYDAQISADGGATWVLITGITTADHEFSGLDSCTNYVVQVRTVCNGGTTAWSTTAAFRTLGCGACIDLPYCPSSGIITADEWIARVTVGTLDNQTGSNNGYGIFTASGTELGVGQGHPITLTPGYSGVAYPEYFKVFVDFDQNGNFTGPGELAYSSGMVTGPVTGTLNIPAGALTGGTRMRVIMIYDDPTAVGCTNGYDYGETEDYCIELVQNTTGVGEGAIADRLRVFPNPSDSEVFFDLAGISAGSTLRIDVLDGIGRTVASQNMDQGRTTLTTSGLANGLYVYRIIRSGVEVASGKFQVQH